MKNSEYVAMKRQVSNGDLHKMMDDVMEARDLLEKIDIYKNGNPVLLSIDKLTNVLYLLDKALGMKGDL